MSPSYLKMKNRTDQWFKLSGAFDDMGTSATSTSYTMNNIANAYSTGTNSATIKWTTPYSGSDQWIYVYDQPPQAQTKPVRRPRPNPAVLAAYPDRSYRRSAPRQFNRYVNGSDLLEEFIAFLGTEGVRQGEVMELPLELFIKWLIIRACEVDQEEAPVVLELPAPKPQPRCLGCQKFMRKDTTLPLHGAQCADRHFARAA